MYTDTAQWLEILPLTLASFVDFFVYVLVSACEISGDRGWIEAFPFIRKSETKEPYFYCCDPKQPEFGPKVLNFYCNHRKICQMIN